MIGCGGQPGEPSTSNADGARATESVNGAGYYVVKNPNGTWLYTANGWLLIHFCSDVYYVPSHADWGSGWIQVWYEGEYHYHPAALGQVNSADLGKTASNGHESCGVI
jgi:hypothetical protein